LIKSKRNTYV